MRKKCYISLHSTKIVEALKKYGVDQLKSYRGCSDEISKNINFWRGVIDGDGTLIVGKNLGRCHVGLVGNKILLQQFIDFCGYAGLNACGPYDKKPSNCFIVHVVGSNCLILCKYLYENSKVYLTRKYEKALNILNLEEELQGRGLDKYSEIFENPIPRIFM